MTLSNQKLTSYKKSNGSGILRSSNVSPLPLTVTQTATLGQIGSVATPALSRPLNAQLSYANNCSPLSTSTTASRLAVVAARI